MWDLCLCVLQAVETSMFPGTILKFIIFVLQAVGYDGGSVSQARVHEVSIMLFTQPQLFKFCSCTLKAVENQICHSETIIETTDI